VITWSIPGVGAWLHPAVDIHVDSLEAYAESAKAHLAVKLAEFEATVEAAAKSIDPNYRDEYYEHHSDEYWELTTSFPRLLRQSVFLSLYGWSEHELTSVCKQIQKQEELRVSLSDLRGDGIQGAFAYLKKVVGVDFATDDRRWEYTVAYNRLRNAVAHQNGGVSDQGQRASIEVLPGVAFDDLHRAELGAEFLPAAFAHFRKLLHDLADRLPVPKSEE